MAYQPKQIAKAITAAVTAGGAALIAGVSDGKLTPVEIITFVVATVVAGLAVFQVPNEPDNKIT